MGLCTYSDVENIIGATFTTEEQTIINDLIEKVSDFITEYCGRDWQTHTNEIEYHDGEGKGHNVIFLKKYPVTAINYVKEDGTTLTEDDNYVWYSDGRIIKVSNGYEDPDTCYWVKKKKAIEVSYNWGVASVPNAIKNLCATIVGRLWLNREKFAESGNATSVNLSGVSVSYQIQNFITDEDKLILNLFRRAFTG